MSYSYYVLVSMSDYCIYSTMVYMDSISIQLSYTNTSKHD